MPRVHVAEESSASPEQVLEAARDFSPRRAELWPDVHVEHLEIHDRGETWAEVTEGNPWPLGLVWERLRYDWSQPGSVKGTVIDSNIFKPGSTWEIRATPRDGGSRVEVIGVRHLRGVRGNLLAPFFPLGLARREVADHLRHFLSRLEAG
jgi:polyketide cyclase/dehydrase/lipid transport protein